MHEVTAWNFSNLGLKTSLKIPNLKLTCSECVRSISRRRLQASSPKAFVSESSVVRKSKGQLFETYSTDSYSNQLIWCTSTVHFFMWVEDLLKHYCSNFMKLVHIKNNANPLMLWYRAEVKVWCICCGVQGLNPDWDLRCPSRVSCSNWCGF